MSTLRWEALLDCIKTTLKRHCDTRWSSRRQAVTALQENHLPSVHKVLQHVTDRANNWTTDTASDAMILLRQIDYEFVCLLEMWSEVQLNRDIANPGYNEPSVTANLLHGPN
ncbi:hypothetical protein AVEN_162952-1 [Araneus ventricosus]|uniref:Uncharacterized protein n=1 Tax=Araneus ventricosus TaxID=182803 RepID=A0A4Y2BZ48_ARAVE|nr:hypothetical protein AVEN_162952-1 [Araneus ventricosus]